MGYNTLINPLIKDLKNLCLGNYLKSSSFERYLVTEKINQPWQSFYDNAYNENVVIGFDTEGRVCEMAFYNMLNNFFEQIENKFYSLILGVLTNFKIYKKEPIDLSEIIADIEILSPPEDTLEALKQLGQDYNEPTKVSMETSEKKEYRSVSDTNPKTKIFISHATNDAAYVEKLVTLLEHIGLQKEHIFCSSIPEYGIPLGKDIFDYLKNEFQEHNLYVIFVLSDNYYNSAACLNEMGAAWILQSSYQAILLPGFEFKNINGAINPRNISFRLDKNKDRRHRTNELKDSILNYLKVQQSNKEMWERHRDNFFDEIDLLNNL